VIRILDKSFDVFIEEDKLQAEIRSLADHINKDFEGQEVLFIAVLNGAFMFAADLMKSISLECEISFVKMSSYKGVQSTGEVNELIGLNADLKGKKVILLEDIVDTGLTMDKILSLVESHEPSSVKICTLLYKPTAFKGKNEPHYIGFSIPDAFVVGYGLDYNERGRNLGSVYQIKNDNN
jgi:hypoxanthine phosphoribosyltransferase